MKALVVYDSVFGNTARIAQAIAAALPALAVPVGEVDNDMLAGLDLLIVGSPTRGFRPTEDTAAMLKGLPVGHLTGTQGAAFDTRMQLEAIDSKALRFMVDKGGYAASTIARNLQKKGAAMAAEPEGFLVTGEEGPLLQGELERAAAWGAGLAGEEAGV